MSSEGIKVLSVNKKARYNYFVDETIECGIVLEGTEVKSIRDRSFSYSDAYCRIKNNELWLIGLHISMYKFGNINNHEPEQDRKLLVHKEELKKLRRKVDEKGFTLVPLKVYLKNGLIKVEMGICKGKKNYDKRDTIKDRDLKKDAAREIKHIN